MLPPPPATTLREANPNFSLLYDRLITNILNHDGSTRSKVAEHDTVAIRLNEARKAVLRDKILLRALEEVAMVDETPKSPSKTTTSGARAQPQREGDSAQARLPPRLKELILNIASYLSISINPKMNASLPSDTDQLMAEELEIFYHHLPEISQRLSKHLINIESNLATLADALSQPTYSNSESQASSTRKHDPTQSESTATPSFTESVTSLTTSTSTIQNITLPTQLTSTTQSLNTLLSRHTQDLHNTIRTLELSTHGTSARHLTSRSTYLNAVSRGVQMKAQTLRLEKEKALYTDEAFLDMLGEEHDALQSRERRLARRERDLRALLEEYEAAGREAVVRTGMGTAVTGGQRQHVPVPVEGSGEDVFRVLGAKYAEIEEELEAVKADVERLEERWLRPRESRAR